jgi:hypothetical protein
VDQFSVVKMPFAGSILDCQNQFSLWAENSTGNALWYAHTFSSKKILAGFAASCNHRLERRGMYENNGTYREQGYEHWHIDELLTKNGEKGEYA